MFTSVFAQTKRHLLPLSEKMSSVGVGEDVLQQVNQLWSMLDDLCVSDPAAYRSFIGKQVEEGAHFTSPIQLHSCLRTDILEPNKGLLYINLCSWKHVPAPQDPSKPLPLCSGKLGTGTSESQGAYTILDLAFNPGVLEENKDKTVLHMLALKVAQQQQHGLRLSQQYTVVMCSPESSPDDLRRRLGLQQWPNTPKQPNKASETPASLLQQITSLRSEQQDEEPTAQIIRQLTENKKKDMIQVISSTFVQPQKPVHHLWVKSDRAGVARSVELTVELPKVCSMSECQLSISKDDVFLEVEDIYHFHLDFPLAVSEDTASAVFNKRKRQLVLKVDVL